jgi:nucleoid-associated protein YgaU
MFDSVLDIEQAFGDGRSMGRAKDRIRVRRRRAAVLLVAISLTMAAPAVARAVSDGHGREGSTTYVVHAGDTLWSIARRHAPGEDPRVVVDAIARANGIDADGLVPGQQLNLPDVG